MEISCQVLAVLILALAIQTRLLSIDRWEKPDERMDSIVVAAILFFGEIAPLTALLCGTNSVILAVPAAYALLFSLGLILAYAVFGEPRSPDPDMAAARGSTTLGSYDPSTRVSIRIRSHQVK
jgi:protein-S-isoprenylcysteine O-methyltransferase Ste14